MKGGEKRKIWIDLDNSPHVPFFRPIIAELERRGYSIFITARDRFQVCELVDRLNINYRRLGRYYGKNKIVKVFWLTIRALQLIPVVMKERPELAISHGSRSQVMVANFLGISSVVIFDYEHAKEMPFINPTWRIVPEVIFNIALRKRTAPILKYSGIKEDVYVPFFKPDPNIMNELGLNGGDLIITIRPPAVEAHYYNPQSEELFEAVMDFLAPISNIRLVLLPRNDKQKKTILKKWPTSVASRRIVIPEHVVDGLNLLWHSDLVVSGGGTMNREAAALGVPVCSIFRGKIGAVDRYLSERGRLTLIEGVEDVKSKIRLIKRPKKNEVDFGERLALKEIVAAIEKVIAMENGHSAKRIGHSVTAEKQKHFNGS